MKVRDLLLEVRLFQNSFIKLDIVETELKKVFSQSDTIPKIAFDKDGMFITIDNFALREYENYYAQSKLNTPPTDNPSDTPPDTTVKSPEITTDRPFTLSYAGVIDEIKNVRKYYIEYIKIPEIEDEEAPSEEEPAPAPAA